MNNPTPIYNLVVTGPECSGKSTLVNALSEYFKMPFVLEYARKYLERFGPSYDANDLLAIAEGQLSLIDEVRESGAPLMICDTGLLVIEIWYQEKFGAPPVELVETRKMLPVDLYVLCYPLDNWEADPLRENPKDRDRLYALYQEKLNSEKVPFIEVQGELKDRLKQVEKELLRREIITFE